MKRTKDVKDFIVVEQQVVEVKEEVEKQQDFIIKNYEEQINVYLVVKIVEV